MIIDDGNETDKLNEILLNLKALNDNQDLGNTKQYLIDAFTSNNNHCLICIESIGTKEAIWNCDGCFEQFHMFCIQKWIKEGSYQTSTTLQANESMNLNKIPWNCPKCRKEYNQQDAPTTYKCYCKKVKNPEFNPWIIPHSCNQPCERVKPCSHHCHMLCHPGPCPPCPIMVKISCNCTKSSFVPRRCSNKYWSCSQPCHKLMPCKQHICERLCHEDACGSCKKTSIQFCECKKRRQEVPCTQPTWNCGQKCLKTFLCGFHQCQKECHSKSCGDCPRSLLRSCPCGKNKSQQPCTFEVPPCGETCEKPLTCAIHKCMQRCHTGECEPCRQIVLKKCRCGQKEKFLPCHVDFTCEIKCSKIRNCGKHKCNRKCCNGLSCAPCEQICNKQLTCKNHKCMSLCHSGPCYPCPVKVELSCPCGISKQKVPCVKSKLDIRVNCKQTCNSTSKCHHEKIQPHYCHYNDCPACNLICNKTLKCGHVCSAVCHSAVQIETIENKDRDGPWVALKVKKEFKNLECPDCPVPCDVKCLGNHETSKLPCYRAESYNCGKKCGRLLECGHHRCQIECHKIDDENCEECQFSCEQEPPQGCVHKCPIGYCHPGNCPDCQQLLKLKCHCAVNFVFIECNKWCSTKIQKEKDLLKSCKVPCPRTISCGHSCQFKCHAGNCSKSSDCIEKVVIKCVCKRLRESLLCKELNLKKNSLIEKSIKGEVKLLLRCNEKCQLKLNKLEEMSNTDETTEIFKQKKQLFSISWKHLFVGFLLALFAILLIFFNARFSYDHKD